MSDLKSVPSTPPIVGGAALSEPKGGGSLKGKMGTPALVLTVLALAAPLACVNGIFPIVISFSGSAASQAYVIAIAVLLAFAVAAAVMSQYVQNPGAFYAYVTAGLGRRVGLGGAFLAILAYWLLATASFAYLGSAVNRLVLQFGGPDISWYWFEIMGWLLVGVVGYLNVEFSARILTFIMVLEVVIVLVFNIMVGVRGGAEGRTLQLGDNEAFTSGSIGVAVLFCVLCFIGFESTAIFREEAVDPDRTVPRAMWLSVLLIGVFYAVSITMMIMAYGAGNAQTVADENAAGMFSDALSTFVGPIFVDVCSVLLVTSVLASLIALQNMLARYLYSLGKDRVLPATFGRAHPRHGSPHIASLVTTGMIGLLGYPFVFTDNEPMDLYGKMVGVGTYALVVLMLLAGIAVFVYFLRNPHPSESIWKTRVAPFVAVVGLIAIAYLATVHIDMITGVTGVLGAGIVALSLGTPMLGFGLAWYYRGRKPEVYARIGRQEL